MKISCTAREEEWVSGSLQLLLSYLIVSSLKQLSIGQSITQVSHPRSIVPVTFDLGNHLKKQIASIWLIE